MDKPQEEYDKMDYVAEYIYKNTDGNFARRIKESLVKRKYSATHEDVLRNIKERIISLYKNNKKRRYHPLYRTLKYKKPENEVYVNMLMTRPHWRDNETLKEYKTEMKTQQLSESCILANSMNPLKLWTQFYLYKNKEEASSTTGTKILMQTLGVYLNERIKSSHAILQEVDKLEKLNEDRVLTKRQLSYDILAFLSNFNELMIKDVILRKFPELIYCEMQHRKEYDEFIESTDLNEALNFRNNWRIVDETTLEEIRNRNWFFNNPNIQEQIKDLTKEQKENQFRLYIALKSVQDSEAVLDESVNEPSAIIHPEFILIPPTPNFRKITIPPAVATPILEEIKNEPLSQIYTESNNSSVVFVPALPTVSIPKDIIFSVEESLIELGLHDKYSLPVKNEPETEKGIESATQPQDDLTTVETPETNDGRLFESESPKNISEKPPILDVKPCAVSSILIVPPLQKFPKILKFRKQGHNRQSTEERENEDNKLLIDNVSSKYPRISIKPVKAPEKRTILTRKKYKEMLSIKR